MLASKMREILNTGLSPEVEKALSDLLTEVCIPQFRLGGNRALIPETRLSARLPYSVSRAEILQILREWGYYGRYFCEDRPCGGCYYEIILPPEEE